MPVTQWRRGDRVVHAGRPEWGVGEVTAAEGIVQDAVRCQRLTIRFARAGLKTLTTAYAELHAAEGHAAITSEPESEDAWPPPSSESAAEVLARLPEPATDPFRSLEHRLKATIDLLRFNGTGASLVDWAVMQTHLPDPLSRFSRHELEQHFERFRGTLISHLRRLTDETEKKDPAALSRVLASAPPAARNLMRRADARR